jgi:hypothetical protein
MVKINIVGYLPMIKKILLSFLTTGLLLGSMATASWAEVAEEAVVYVPAKPIPERTGSGKRIIYSLNEQHVWLINKRGVLIADFPTAGRADKPGVGRYRVASKSPKSRNLDYEVTFNYMVRFAKGQRAWIGFHDIPRTYDGKLWHTRKELGTPIGKGGCPHLAKKDAKFLYNFAKVGTRVVVVS